MKFSSILALAAAATAVDAHAIFQKLSVNGVEQTALKGVRAPTSNNPIEDVNHADFACNTGIVHKDSNVVDIPAGARVGAWWGHVIGGAQYSGDADHPIAASHKGPIQVYLAKVSNAATTGTSGLKWFKVAEEGLSNGKWAVDNMIANGGWHYFNLPSCVAPGNYLMRVELLALHSAGGYPGAQFYMECAQINVTGGGSSTGTDLVSFPGAYASSHPGITISIYGSTGQPDNGGKAYSIPGPAVLSCGSSGSGSGSGSTPSTPTTTAAAQQSTPTTVKTDTGATAPLWGQCGGTGWTGATTCASGTCKKLNDYYSQCT